MLQHTKNTVICFHTSDTLLTINSDASYLVLPQVRIKLAGYFCLTTSSSIDNGAVWIECKSIRHMVSYTAEAETHSIFHNAWHSVSLRSILIGTGHLQPPATSNTHNKVAEGYKNNDVQLKNLNIEIWYYIGCKFNKMSSSLMLNEKKTR